LVIWALHGFLGEGRDWDFLREAGFPVESPDFLIAPLHSTIAEWGKEFADTVASRDRRPVLLGYSLGGRIALHALIARPEVFRAAVIVSAGLGVEGEPARSQRRAQDEQWARRFETESWSSVVKAWNAQPLFAGTPERPRDESRFNRAALAHALRAWSPAAHEPLMPQLSGLQLPILWVAGERDAKYVAEARRAEAALAKCEVWICPDAGHRVPWDQPERFLQRVRAFLASEEVHGQQMEDPARVSGHQVPGD